MLNNEICFLMYLSFVLLQLTMTNVALQREE